MAALIVIVLPMVVGMVALLQPPPAAPHTGTDGRDVDTAANQLDTPEVWTRPTWTRPAWANALSDTTVLELQASNDVPFANGRLRPRLGISCSEGSTDVYIVTGGTAQIDPQTSRHVVRVGFDKREPHAEPWIGANDQRALFAPEPLAFLARIAQSRQLDFTYTHYMAGATAVTFNLTGADETIVSMAPACGFLNN